MDFALKSTLETVGQAYEADSPADANHEAVSGYGRKENKH